MQTTTKNVQNHKIHTIRMIFMIFEISSCIFYIELFQNSHFWGFMSYYLSLFIKKINFSTLTFFLWPLTWNCPYYRWHATHDMWYLTPDKWHLTCKIILNFCASMLLFSCVERFSVTRTRYFRYIVVYLDCWPLPQPGPGHCVALGGKGGGQGL